MDLRNLLNILLERKKNKTKYKFEKLLFFNCLRNNKQIIL